MVRRLVVVAAVSLAFAFPGAAAAEGELLPADAGEATAREAAPPPAPDGGGKSDGGGKKKKNGKKKRKGPKAGQGAGGKAKTKE